MYMQKVIKDNKLKKLYKKIFESFSICFWIFGTYDRAFFSIFSHSNVYGSP